MAMLDPALQRRWDALPERPLTYYIHTYGCQMNAHDSQALSATLLSMGLCPCPTKEAADLVMLNTCAIRDNAVRKALGNMMWLRLQKKSNPRCVLCVCGCMVEQPNVAEQIRTRYPFFDVAFGTGNHASMPRLLIESLEKRTQVLEVTGENAPLPGILERRRERPFQAFLNIMYGCDNFCSYCIVPYVRGRERSRPQDEIIREAEGLLQQGVQEITLLGQNVNSYGRGLAKNATFPALLRSLDRLGVPRIRFMTSHPKDLSDALIDAMATCPSIAPHLHLPVQSGSDSILFAMNRRYTAGQYLDRLAQLRQAMPHIAVTSDIIVAFPGETEADFEQTLQLVRAAHFDAAFTFIFSSREGTVAATMPDPVAPERAKERIERLIALQEGITQEVFLGLVGSQQTVLVESASKRNAQQLSGKCGRNITCSFEGQPDRIGTFVPVLITGAGHNTLKASVQKEAVPCP